MTEEEKDWTASEGVPRHVTRDRKFKKLLPEDVTHFVSILGKDNVLTDREKIDKTYNQAWLQQFKGNSSLVLFPCSTLHVSEIMKYCWSQTIAVCIQGGNTDLVGGSTPIFDEVILSLVKMNRIESFDELSGIVLCEAGTVLEDLDNHLKERGFTVPYDLGPRRRCHVGGNVATNAGGLRFLRYGSLHGNVIGLEVVRADGTVLDMMSTLRKDNTGFDLKQLFIGAEGTLGVITKVSLLAVQKPKHIHTCFVGLENFEKVLQTLQKARRDLSEILSAVEFVTLPAVKLVLKHIHRLKGQDAVLPFDDKCGLYMLLETSGSNAEHDLAKIQTFLDEAKSSKLIVNGVYGADGPQTESWWRLRTRITRCLSFEGPTYKYDISLPVKDMHQISLDLQEHLQQRATVISFGHLGDGNLHLNVSSTEAYSEELRDVIEAFIYGRLEKVRGSISAEHGLGVMKAHKIFYSKSATLVQVMRQFKEMFDSKGILNPYKVLPPDAQTPAKY